jgi:hypothetical protein
VSTPGNETEEETNFRTEVAQIFERDWESSYALPLNEVIHPHKDGFIEESQSTPSIN